MPHDLLVEQGLAERDPLVGPGSRLFERGLRTCLAFGGNLQSLLRELVHERVKPLILLAEQRFGWHIAVLEEELRRVLCLEPHLLEFRAFVKTRRARLDQEEGEAVRTFLGCGLGYHHHDVRQESVGDVRLRAVEHKALAIVRLGSSRADSLQIGSRHRLSHGDSQNFLACVHIREVLHLLLLGSEMEEVGHDNVRVEVETRPRGRSLGVHLLLPDDCRVEDVRTQSSVLFRAIHAEEAHFTRLEPHLAIDMPLFFPLRVVGHNMLTEKLAATFPEHVMIGVEEAAGADGQERVGLVGLQAVDRSVGVAVRRQLGGKAAGEDSRMSCGWDGGG
mmetsp:Transcript_20696/g.47993  ORF Transcript_20696/g.47993 Transcript_20696/m.47993 type:complete len:333 (+) Transcript_20696:398-1396(+)